MRKQQVTVDGVKQWVLSSKLEERPSGLPARDYKLINGQYKIAIEEQVMVDAEELIIKKGKRNKNIDELTVEVNGVAFHANERSMSRMATRLATAEPDDLIDWKCIDGWETVTEATLREALKLASIQATLIWRMKDEQDI